MSVKRVVRTSDIIEILKWTGENIKEFYDFVGKEKVSIISSFNKDLDNSLIVLDEWEHRVSINCTLMKSSGGSLSVLKENKTLCFEELNK